MKRLELLLDYFEGCEIVKLISKSLLATKVKALKKELIQTLASGPSNTILFQELACLIPGVWLTKKSRLSLSLLFYPVCVL